VGDEALRLLTALLLGGCGAPASRGVAPPTPSPPTPPVWAPAPVADPTPGPSALAEGFRRPHAEWLEVVGARRATLTLTGWPAQPFEIVAARVLRAGAVRVWSSYVRTRPEGESLTVQLGVWIDATPTGTARLVSSGQTTITRVNVGDVVEIPVPLADPWGARSAFAWGTPEPAEVTSAETSGRDCSAEEAAAIARLAALAPVLAGPRALCGSVLLASLRERRTVHFVVDAATPGTLDAPRVRVSPAGSPLTILPTELMHRELRPNGGGSYGAIGIEDVTVELRVGDRLQVGAPP
jgi:hypothetical protein